MKPTITVYGKFGKIVCIIGGIFLILFGIYFHNTVKNEDITYFSGRVNNIYGIEDHIKHTIKGYKYYFTAKADITSNQEKYNITLIRQSRKKFPYYEENPEILFPKECATIELQRDVNGKVQESQRNDKTFTQIIFFFIGAAMLIGGIFGKVKEK